jgi:hypothetical protein
MLRAELASVNNVALQVSRSILQIVNDLPRQPNVLVVLNHRPLGLDCGKTGG